MPPTLQNDNSVIDCAKNLYKPCGKHKVQENNPAENSDQPGMPEITTALA